MANYPAGLWDKLREELDKKPPEVLDWLAKGNKDLNFMMNDKGKGYWNRGEQLLSVDLISDAKGTKKSPHTTFFHEYGHLMDTSLGQVSGKSTGKAIYNLLEKEYSGLGGTKKGVSSSLFRELADNDNTSGVQDIISGLTQDKGGIVRSHSRSYWTRRSPDRWWEDVSSEAMAHLNSAYCQPEVKEEFIKYFPKTYEYFIREVVGNA